MAQDQHREQLSDVAGATPGDRVDAVRAVVYDDGELIAPEDLNDALEAAGVTVSVADDGTPKYTDAPAELSVTACHLAVDLRRDPAQFITGAEESPA